MGQGLFIAECLNDYEKWGGGEIMYGPGVSIDFAAHNVSGEKASSLGLLTTILLSVLHHIQYYSEK